MKVEWVTKSEIDNRGFNLYRSTGKEGTYVKLNQEIIPGLLSSASGRIYTFYDDGLIRGQPYYYKLEDIDLAGGKTLHGPVCIDWNGNGVPDDVDPNRNVYSSDGAGKGGRVRRLSFRLGAWQQRRLREFHPARFCWE